MIAYGPKAKTHPQYHFLGFRYQRWGHFGVGRGEKSVSFKSEPKINQNLAVSAGLTHTVTSETQAPARLSKKAPPSDIFLP